MKKAGSKTRKNVNKLLGASLFSLILVAIAGCGNRNYLILADGGESNYQVVILSGSDSTVKAAATDLALYLSMVSGADFKAVLQGDGDTLLSRIYVGVPENRDSIEAIHIANSGKDIFIYGNSSDNSSAAIYHFLEAFLGVRWLAPDAEIVPKIRRPGIKKPLDYTYIPDITTRTVHSRLFYDNPVFASRMRVTTEPFPGYVPEARVHTFRHFIPEEIFFRSHPDYFALKDGKRVPTQLCLSNSDVIRIVKDSVRACFERYPEAEIISVSQNDNTLYCECDDCAAIDKSEGSHAGTMIRFVNEIAGEFPLKMISTLAYQYTRKPTITHPAGNVLVTLCSIECNRALPIEEGCTDFASDLSGWRDMTENIRIWDYTTQFTNFLAPFPNFHTLAPNIRFFRDNNARWIFEQHSNNPSELFELRSYLTARLLWNPDLDYRAVIKEFTDGYYGRAGRYISQYVDDITGEIEADSTFFLFLYGDPSQGFGTWLRPERLEHYETLFDRAEETVSGDSVLLKRVREARLGVDYAILEASRKGLTGRYSIENNRDKTAGLLEHFSQVCQAAGITMMNEMGYTVEEYTASYLETIGRSLVNNIARAKPVTLLTSPKKYAGEDPQALTDGAAGGASFYSNWLGFEGNDMIAVIDLGEIAEVDTISTAFLQVTNHIVFFPATVKFSYSVNGTDYMQISSVNTARPLLPGSRVNDIEYYDISFAPVEARYVKIEAENIKQAPGWHNSAGLPAWIFCDEVIVN